MNSAKREGEKGQSGLQDGVSAAEWLSQHPVISSENNISLQVSPNPSLGEYFFQPTLIKNNNKKCGRRKG